MPDQPPSLGVALSAAAIGSAAGLGIFGVLFGAWLMWGRDQNPRHPLIKAGI